MNRQEQLKAKRQDILDVANRYGAHNLRIFGSVVRGEDQADSDIDFLVDMEANRSLLEYIHFIQELEALLGCKVDVAKPSGLHPMVRDRILQ